MIFHYRRVAIATFVVTFALVVHHATTTIAAVRQPVERPALPPATCTEGKMTPWGPETPFQVHIPRTARPGDVSTWVIPTRRACRVSTSPDGSLIAAEWSVYTKHSQVHLWRRTEGSVVSLGELGPRFSQTLPAPFGAQAENSLYLDAVRDGAVDLRVRDYVRHGETFAFTARVDPSGAITPDVTGRR